MTTGCNFRSIPGTWFALGSFATLVAVHVLSPGWIVLMAMAVGWAVNLYEHHLLEQKQLEAEAKQQAGLNGLF